MLRTQSPGTPDLRYNIEKKYAERLREIMITEKEYLWADSVSLCQLATRLLTNKTMANLTFVFTLRKLATSMVLVC